MLLRHELVHVRDMVDPRFGDDPSLPSVDGGPMRVKLALQRYRVLWDTVIDGRLFGSGRAGPRAREVRRAEFAAAFGTLGKSDQEFERWFGMTAPTHRGLLEVRPRAATCPDRNRAGRRALSSLPLPHLGRSPLRRRAEPGASRGDRKRLPVLETGGGPLPAVRRSLPEPRPLARGARRARRISSVSAADRRTNLRGSALSGSSRRGPMRAPGRQAGHRRLAGYLDLRKSRSQSL
jgi:hypothetical protein